ncbi:MAG TPA: PEP/pyruvate-binding domain-containing protein [Thermotogota bacterium]|nr:PEP/pyruvate-binding domain-containing protein [Thermotogota bacterium]HPB87153.1 PEP/pyruvate-binding domain-containing protein [Thermotogota bacterium]
MSLNAIASLNAWRNGIGVKAGTLNYRILPLSKVQREGFGAKIDHCAFLYRHRFRIPESYILLKTDTADKSPNLEKWLHSDRSYVLRSSASVEDRLDRSYAGQFDSYLNLSSTKEIEKKLRLLFQQPLNRRVEATQAQSQDRGPIVMHALLQEMIHPRYSGVVFSRNPLTGLDEIIIEYTEGHNARILQEGQTPFRAIYKWGEWKETPRGFDHHLEFLTEIIQEVKRAKKEFGADVDMEWAFDGQSLYWLQLREITTGKRQSIYSNRISKEMLPGMIKPLVWSINIPVVNQSWKDLFAELLGPNDLDIFRLARSIHYRAYFNMGVLGDLFELLGMPRELLEILLGIENTGKERPKFRPGFSIVRHLPRLFRFVLKSLAVKKRIIAFLSEYDVIFQSLDLKGLSSYSMEQLVDQIETLKVRCTEASYFNIVTPLLSAFYSNYRLSKALETENLRLEDIDFSEVESRIADIQPAVWLQELKTVYDGIEKKEQVRVEEDNLFIPEMDLHANRFRRLFRELIRKFGHLSDSGNDFSTVSWKEDPASVMNLILSLESVPEKVSKKGPDAFTSHATARKYKKACDFRVLKERVSFLYTYGYSLFRPLFLEIANRIKDKGFLKNETDLFFLSYEEVKRFLAERNAKEIATIINKRKKDFEELQDVEMPEVVFGDDLPTVYPKGGPQSMMKGVGVSGGYVEGPVKVLKTTKDASKVDKGDIIVIPFSDIGWTPTILKAGGVISEAGGLLSHAAIIAREYRIPAIVSVSGAMNLKDSMRVSLNGISGEVAILREETSRARPPEVSAAKQRRG